MTTERTSDADGWLLFADSVLARGALAGGESDVDASELEAAAIAVRAEFHAGLSSDVPFALLVSNADLDPVEAEVLAVAAAVESSAARRRLLPPGPSTRLTLDAVHRLLGHEHLLALGPDSTLLSAAIVELLDDGAWADQIVAVPAAVLWALAGSSAPDPDVPVDAIVVGTDAAGGHPLVVVAGADRMRRRQAACINTAGTRFLATPLPTAPQQWPAIVREATLTGSGVILELDESLPDIARRWITRAVHLPWAISSPHDVPVADLPRREWLEVDPGDAATSAAEQAAMLGDDAGGAHKLTLDQLHTIARVLPARNGDLAAAVRRLGSGRLEQLARRIRPTRTWDDIVLGDEQREQLHSVVDRYRFAHRVYGEWGFAAQPSAGIVALFAGPSGTGKTLAAEIVAGALDLDVFKLDLSSVVSKYIGETEKNLEEVFGAASAGNLVLFFDEADSLFGKRSEVSDAHDRYANIEVSYLLQKLETYEGLVLLATNFEKNIDEAFMRRIHVRVQFPMPAVDQRERIWQLNLPAAAPTENVDLRFLAERFEVSGATIRNAAINTAFAAAARGTAITMDGLITGVSQEFLKAGRLLKPEHFAGTSVGNTPG